jgi:hypothetical protein
MRIALTASYDACQPSVSCHKDEKIFQRLPHLAMQGRSSSQGRKSPRNLVKGIGFGVCLLAALGFTSATPASAAELRAGYQESKAKPSSLGRVPPFSVMPVTVDHAKPFDPLGGVIPTPAIDSADYSELQRQIIVSMPLTNPPASEGENDDQVAVEAPEFVDFEEMRVPRWIVDTILRASEVTDADPVYMMALADKESSFLPGNKASTSSAVGLFQFITSTWLEAVRSFGPKLGLIMEAKAIEGPQGKLSVPDETLREHILGLRRNPYLSALMAAEMMKRDKAKIESKLGRKLSRSEFYLSHFFGVDSASKFIALVDDKPKKSAPSAFPAAAKSNKSLFFAKDGKKTRQLSVSEVYGKIDTMIDKRLSRYEDVSTRVTADASF